MTDHDGPPHLTRLAFHGPLSEERAARVVRRLVRTGPATVLDVGCGWGELTLRLLAAAPRATAVGLDTDGESLARARRAAAARGLADRVEFAEESARGTVRGPADVVLCVGSGHALTGAEPPGHVPAALRELRRLVAPGGRVLFGEGFWQRVPAPAELAGMWPGASAADHPELAGLVDAAVTAGFRPEWTETANGDEWEEFESGYQADAEEWLAAHGDRPGAGAVRERLDRHRAAWLHYRGVLGMAYLTLIPA
ncbi:SAM-dependent methyltransferase [Streptomyces carminius]|uniref:SAM-dependent methyltransferase n=1 Tax=Streptomyces carminius TaxID=2665496 RepID=A0A2M8M0L3_9ACTN|nr:class I SAM-dependent methyltransferase [Streptomyces carminius]PJE97028.1 SAM-dependent methyltransferase [Streptomyces carminius]PJE97737.1 SAM-dependent methyltransferase [Streptomyces carminius]